jgi:phage terminase large subunit-like protein
VSEKPLRLERTLGPWVASWIEANLVHGPGDVQGQPIRLDDEQLRFIFRAYEIDDDGRRVVRRAVFSRPKGRAKSELAAMLACCEALGPCRFAGWDADGRPIAKPVDSPVVLCVATEEGQAGNVFDAIVTMLREGAVADTPGLDVGITRVYTPGGGTIRPTTAAATSKDGGRETFAVFDETHLWSNRELHSLHDTIRRNLAKRKAAEPWSLEVSTMYALGENSVAEGSHKFAQAVQEGKISGNGLLFDHRQGPEGFDYSDDDQLRAALADAYGDAAEWMDLDRMVAEARDPASREGDFRRYFLNQPTRPADSWITGDRWASLAVPGLECPEGSEIWVGVDLSLKHDSTGIAWAFVTEDGRVGVKAHVISPRENAVAHEYHPGGIDIGRVEELIVDLSRRFHVRSVVYDPRFMERSAQILSEEHGLVVAPINQSSVVMLRAYQSWYQAVQEGRVCHDGDRVLERHVTSTAAVAAEGGWKIRKLRQSHRIDAHVAAVMAHSRAEHDRNHVEAPSIYEERGIVTL